ncbi:hypothetical protein [Bifidobacterium asteroides]|uniref:hypothetical protein n=1 Tax=Bifidobacterium asteroides TaxID=1684 RepID=UPI0015E885B1|nr:hypothetical protein [Bifidobacterium asteroides]
MSERTRITCVSTSAAGFGAEQREETRIIPRQATIQDLTDTSDRVDEITIETEEEES